MDVSANDLLREILADSVARTPFMLYWVAVNGDRDRIAREIVGARRRAPIVPWVLRSAGFDEPNAVGIDATRLLERARSEVLAVSQSARMTGAVSVVILSRRELGMSVSASPMLLPQWFPVDGGLTVTARIRDLTWVVRVPISDRSSSVSEMQRLLFELDGTILERAKRHAMDDQQFPRGLFDLIGAQGSTMDVLLSFEQAHARTLNPSAFRPSTRGGTLVGVIWGHVNATSPDRLHRTAKAMNRALQIGRCRC